MHCCSACASLVMQWPVAQVSYHSRVCTMQRRLNMCALSHAVTVIPPMCPSHSFTRSIAQSIAQYVQSAFTSATRSLVTSFAHCLHLTDQPPHTLRHLPFTQRHNKYRCCRLDRTHRAATARPTKHAHGWVITAHCKRTRRACMLLVLSETRKVGKVHLCL